MASAPKKLKKEKSETKLDNVKGAEEKDDRSLCERVNCPTEKLNCVLEVCHECINRQEEDTKNHPWTHLSLGEHVCNVCIEYYTKSHGLGNADFHRWKKVWAVNARSEALIETFICDQLLPYWTQCMRCNKWREMGRYFELSRELAENFICTSSCEEPEDERVRAAKQSHWINTLLYPPYLTQSPAAPFLKAYYPDAVGMSASENLPTESGGDNYARPFHEANNTHHAMSIRPDVMDFDETLEFREFACAQQMYLCLRNLVIASWVKNSMEWITLDKCRHSLICRGLVRIRCVQDLERVIAFLTLKSVVNCGILPQPPPSVFASKSVIGDVVIIGAGMAGLAAAQHLYKHGVKAVVLEAKDRVGGRIHACRLASGSLLSLGPDVINGSVNNPVSLMARQSKLTLQEFSPSMIAVIGKLNRYVSPDSLRKAENRFLEIIDLMYEWAHNPDNASTPDVSIKVKVDELNKILEEEEQLTEEENLVFGMHIKTLAMSLGCDLDQVSAKYWNAHEDYPQFGGPSFMIKQGLGALLLKMAGGLNVEYNKQVEKIKSADKIEILCTDGSTYICSKVICTVSLAVLQSNSIKFEPELRERKLTAINSMKCGQLEKVVMHFKKKFWAAKMHGFRLFTSLSVLSDQESPVHLFFDMSNNTGHILAVYLWGDKLKRCIHALTSKDEIEKKITDICLASLQQIFPTVPPPVTVTVSSWKADAHTGMSRAFIPVGGFRDCYKHLAEPINNSIYFAGEATISSHPHSVAGAYISGVQQAIHIMDATPEIM